MLYRVFRRARRCGRPGARWSTARAARSAGRRPPRRPSALRRLLRGAHRRRLPWPSRSRPSAAATSTMTTSSWPMAHAWRSRPIDDAALRPADRPRRAGRPPRRGWRPSSVASRDRRATQAMAVARSSTRAALRLSWWSTLDPRGRTSRSSPSAHRVGRAASRRRARAAVAAAPGPGRRRRPSRHRPGGPPTDAAGTALVCRGMP